MHRLAPLVLPWLTLAAPTQQPPAPSTTTTTTTTAATATLRLPAFTGYAHPDPEAIERRDDGSIASCRGAAHFYVLLTQPGELTIQLERDRAPNAPPLRASVQPTTAATTATPTLLQNDRATFAIAAPGYHRIALTADNQHANQPDNQPIPSLRAILLSGPAAANAHANTAERRNAASIHLGYPAPKEHRDNIAWFYAELTPQTDPVWSYYMATGWHRGYFGMQVNSATERRIIFSVWDAGDEAIDRGKVAADNRVKLIAKGDGVYAGDFGNEGTGGHSHWKHSWKLGETFRFLLHAAVDGDATIYTGWFWLAEQRQWRLIASFRAPKDGKLLHGLYSFSENFSGSNGDLHREAELGNVWLRNTAGEWLPIVEARFTHDETGKDVRRDRWASVRGDRWVLRHGDFTAPPAGAATRYGEPLRLPNPAAKPPTAAELPQPPARR